MFPGPFRRARSGIESRAAKLGDTLAFWTVAAFGIFLLLASYWIPAAKQMRALERDEGRLSAEIRELRDENDRLECRLHALYNDPYYIERILRRELGYQRDGEEVIKPDLVKVDE